MVAGTTGYSWRRWLTGGLQNAVIIKIRDFPVCSNRVTGMDTDVGARVHEAPAPSSQEPGVSTTCEGFLGQVFSGAFSIVGDA